MRISLDYDDTYTRDPSTWDKIIALLKEAGHEVLVVTARKDVHREEVEHSLCYRVHTTDIYNTNLKAKKEYMDNLGIIIDVWIDDNPSAIVYDYEGPDLWKHEDE